MLKLLDPTIKLHTIRAKGRMADRSGYFDLGEISARCLDGAREAGERGISPEDLALKGGTFAATFFLATLAALEREGVRLEEL